MRTLITFIAMAVSIFTCAGQEAGGAEGRILVAYYSATGTTRAQAEVIAGATGGVLHEITPAEKYTAADLDWRNKQSRSSIEMKDESSRPELGGEQINAADFDIIFIGYPIWWDLCPRVVNTWIESQGLEGKKVVPFATSGGSGIAHSVKALRGLYPEIDWQDGKLLNGPAKAAAKWAESMAR